MKSRIVYICKNCGAHSARWAGRCSSCGAWDSFEEQLLREETGKSVKIGKDTGKIVQLKDIRSESEFRIKTNIVEFDRVLGGGFIPGSLILVGGDPGIGKSTLMLQICSKLVHIKPLFVSGEESPAQIRFHSNRLADMSHEIYLLAETNISGIITAAEKSRAGLIVIDSIQSVFSEDIDALPGSIVQVRECSMKLMEFAKKSSTAVFLIGHVTKDGMIAGPKVLEHLVDTVLQFEGEKINSYRILRSLKNRFGSTNEIGIFEMGESGMKEVLNPSELFLAMHATDFSGISVVAAIEGTRPILLEVQALVSPTGFSVPQRVSTGYDLRRLNMLLAVLEKRLGEKFRQHDVFINLAGGIYLNDPAIDLGLAVALVSSLRDQPADTRAVCIGEIGLTGEIRPVPAIEHRISEAQKLGYERVFIPKSSFGKLGKSYKINICPVERISLALAQLI